MCLLIFINTLDVSTVKQCVMCYSCNNRQYVWHYILVGPTLLSTNKVKTFIHCWQKMMYSLCVVSLDINSKHYFPHASDRYSIAFLKMCTYVYIKKIWRATNKSWIASWTSSTPSLGAVFAGSIKVSRLDSTPSWHEI